MSKLFIINPYNKAKIMATLIKTSGEIQEVKPNNGKYFELKELQDYVGGFIEGIGMPDNSMMYVNEEGFINGLPQNIEATKTLDKYMRVSIPIMGDVIIVPFNEEFDFYD